MSRDTAEKKDDQESNNSVSISKPGCAERKEAAAKTAQNLEKKKISGLWSKIIKQHSWKKNMDENMEKSNRKRKNQRLFYGKRKPKASLKKDEFKTLKINDGEMSTATHEVPEGAAVYQFQIDEQRDNSSTPEMEEREIKPSVLSTILNEKDDELEPDPRRNAESLLQEVNVPIRSVDVTSSTKIRVNNVTNTPNSYSANNDIFCEVLNPEADMQELSRRGSAHFVEEEVVPEPSNVCTIQDTQVTTNCAKSVRETSKWQEAATQTNTYIPLMAENLSHYSKLTNQTLYMPLNPLAAVNLIEDKTISSNVQNPLTPHVSETQYVEAKPSVENQSTSDFEESKAGTDCSSEQTSNEQPPSIQESQLTINPSEQQNVDNQNGETMKSKNTKSTSIWKKFLYSPISRLFPTTKDTSAHSSGK